MNITLFAPCFVDQLYPEVAMATARVLEKLGHEVVVPPELHCCGQPAFNSGYWDEARAVAARVIDSLAGAETVVLPSGSCAAMIREFYPELFRGTDRESAARDLAGRVFEFAEFLVSRLGVTDTGASFPAKVTYHDGCHGLRELGVKSAPRQLLASVRGLQLTEMDPGETCCGFGGTFAVKFPAISTAMAETKCAAALATGADYVVSGDSSCLMQIAGMLRRQGRPMKTIHLAEILAKFP